MEAINPVGEAGQASGGGKLGANELAGEQLDINQAGRAVVKG